MTSEPMLQAMVFSPVQDAGCLNARHASEKIHIRACDVGLGVFAGRDIMPGEIILALEGPLIDFAETKRRGPRECMAIQIGPNRYIDTQPPACLSIIPANPMPAFGKTNISWPCKESGQDRKSVTIIPPRWRNTPSPCNASVARPLAANGFGIFPPCPGRFVNITLPRAS